MTRGRCNARFAYSKVDEVAKKNELSRQKLIEAILEQVISDKGFVLTVKEIRS